MSTIAPATMFRGGEPDRSGIVDQIPLDATAVLEIGCGPGDRGVEYRRRNPQARYFGLEWDPALVRIAAARLDRAELVPADGEATAFPETRFDCIVFTDLTRAGADPWRLVQDYAALLTKAGTVVIYAPNAEHWRLHDRMTRGNAPSDLSGQGAVPHFPLFTDATVRRSLRALGLACCDVRRFGLADRRADLFIQAMEPALSRLGVDREDFRRRVTPSHYIFRAVREVTPVTRIVSTSLLPIGGVTQVRITDPMAAVSTIPGFDISVVESSNDVDARPDGGICVLHRPALTGEAGLSVLQSINRAGYIVVTEFDDHPDFIPILQHAELYNFRGVHAVQTSTPALADVLRRHNPEIAVFENAISILPDVRNYLSLDRLSVFYAGINREKEWPVYMDAINAVAEMAKDRIFFEVIADRGFFDALATSNKRYTPLCDYQTYLHLLAGCEISLMPLADTPFNHCKSDLKFIEAAASRVTAVASPIAYDRTLEDGETGVLFRNPTELYQRLLRLITNPEIARRIGDQARSYVVAHRMLAYQARQRADWYRSLWARREVLHAQLLERVPQLAGAR